MAVKNIIELTDEQFNATVSEGDTPILVDFWAPWCGPCRRVAPIVEELAQEYEGRLRVAKVNIDDHQEAANQYDVTGIPTLLFFKNGELAHRINQAVPKEVIVEALERIL
jgi:thioredoxin 1